MNGIHKNTIKYLGFLCFCIYISRVHISLILNLPVSLSLSLINKYLESTNTFMLINSKMREYFILTNSIKFFIKISMQIYKILELKKYFGGKNNRKIDFFTNHSYFLTILLDLNKCKLVFMCTISKRKGRLVKKPVFLFFLSLLSDSNQRPRDYKSRALAN